MNCPIGCLALPKNASTTFSACVKSIMAIELPNDFKEFLKLLTAHEVEYLLVGGYAVGYYGYPRATGDLDIWIAVHPDNAHKLMRVLSEFGFGAVGVSEALF